VRASSAVREQCGVPEAAFEDIGAPARGAVSLDGLAGPAGEEASYDISGDALERIARRGVAHGSGLGKQRWVVERGFAWLHAFKRLRTRYERRGDIHLGLLQLACADLLPPPAVVVERVLMACGPQLALSRRQGVVAHRLDGVPARPRMSRILPPTADVP
jgi:hypothetical protein